MLMAPHIPADPPMDSTVVKTRILLLELDLSRHCLESFTRIADAHAILMSLLITVNLVGFLQPPRGWDEAGDLFDSLPSLKAFAIFNSLSLYSATSGLVFYVYCSYATSILSLSSFSLPTHSEHLDDLDRKLLNKLRSALRRVALPAVRRRSAFLFLFMQTSLTFCVATYISGGIAASKTSNVFLSVILPAIPGCLLIIALLCLCASKISLELDFDRRLKTLWDLVDMPEPPTEELEAKFIRALDPLPRFAQKCLSVISFLKCETETH